MEKTRVKLYNVLRRRKEIFRPIRKDWVGLYTCGPTVYNFAHIGNLRTYIFEDVLRRTLEYAGYEVRHVMNITDVDDKIIRDAKKAGKSIFEFVKPYERAFFEDIKKLNIKRASKFPKATKHIKEMKLLIQNLLEKGLAYKAGGSVYFDISKFKKYGRLSGLRHGNRTSDGSTTSYRRIDTDEYDKEDIQDFVLWKGKKPGEPSWSTPFGKGRPGWHIECSAMSMKYLGSTFDIHAGGIDLIFPHHENEIAQSEGATGKPFVNFFVEGEHLLVEGNKMSKSIGNIITLRDIESRGFHPLAFRYLTLGAHYRSKINFTWKSLEAAQNSLEKLHDFIRDLKKTRKQNLYSGRYKNFASVVKKRFKEAVFNDLDTAQALAVMWELIHDFNQNPLRYNPKEILKILYDFDKILGLGFKTIKPEKIPGKIMSLVQKRENLRKEKKWEEADLIREEIRKLGYTIEDKPEGPNLKKI